MLVPVIISPALAAGMDWFARANAVGCYHRIVNPGQIRCRASGEVGIETGRHAALQVDHGWLA